MSLLTIQNLSFSYDGQTVLSDVNFNINQGDYLCIVGENGAGKTTLMKGLLSLKKPQGGTIELGDGLETNEIGYLPQQTSIQKDFPASVYEVVLSGNLNSLHMRPFYRRKEKLCANEKMELLEISDLKNKSYKDLSGGQQQRVLLARALCASKKILLLDEPANGLDPLMKLSFYQLIKRINLIEKITVIVVSHDIDGVLEAASHILHIDKKQLFFGRKEEYLLSEAGQYFIGGAKNAFRVN